MKLLSIAMRINERGNDNHLCFVANEISMRYLLRTDSNRAETSSGTGTGKFNHEDRASSRRFPSGSPRVVHAVKLYSITGVLNIALAVGYGGWRALRRFPDARVRKTEAAERETGPRALAYGTHSLAHSLYNSVISMLIPPAGSRYSPWWMHGHRRIALFIEIQLKLNSFAALVDLRRG